MDVAKVLKDAWQAVQDSGVPKELQETALNRAIDLLAPRQPANRRRPPQHHRPGLAAAEQLTRLAATSLGPTSTTR